MVILLTALIIYRVINVDLRNILELIILIVILTAVMATTFILAVLMQPIY